MNMKYFITCFLSLFLLINGKVTKNYEYNDDSLRINLPKDCGRTRFTNISSRIINGEKASLGQFPWMARLGLRRSNRTTFFCGGALISRYYVVTAAHCMESEGNIVRLGENYLNTYQDCDKFKVCAPLPQDIKINKFIYHNKYCPLTSANDYAVIELKDAAKFNEFVQPICLPAGPLPHEDLMKELLTISGWGMTDSVNETLPDYLMYITAPLLDNDKCNALYPNKVQDHQLCIGYKKGKDSCDGDSGGPVVKTVEQNRMRRAYLVGLVSYGLPYCGYGPAVYTDVSYFVPWTMKKLKKN